MSSYRITPENLLRTLPDVLRNDSDMLALATGIAEKLSIISIETGCATIYTQIDQLSEKILDVLAYDLKVDWYNYNHPIEAKREVIKNSVKVHRRMGTLHGLKTGLRGVYPNSEVEEWFSYSGSPYTFRVILDVTNAKAPAEYGSIENTVNLCKRLSTHMESLIYQCRIGIEIAPQTEKFLHCVGYAGQRTAGTYPQRNILATLRDAGVDVKPQGDGYRFIKTQAGTRPQRAVAAALRASAVQVSGEGVRFPYRTMATGQNNAGELPHRNAGGAVENVEVEANTAGTGYRFTVSQAGTEPERSTTAVGEKGGITPEVKTESFYYRTKLCGTSRCAEK